MGGGRKNRERRNQNQNSEQNVNNENNSQRNRRRWRRGKRNNQPQNENHKGYENPNNNVQEEYNEDNFQRNQNYGRRNNNYESNYRNYRNDYGNSYGRQERDYNNFYNENQTNFGNPFEYQNRSNIPQPQNVKNNFIPEIGKVSSTSGKVDSVVKPNETLELSGQMKPKEKRTMNTPKKLESSKTNETVDSAVTTKITETEISHEDNKNSKLPKPITKIKQESKSDKSSSDSDDSSDSSSSEESKQTNANIIKKFKKEKSPNHDVICLGKRKNKIILDDESSPSKSQSCQLCEKEGHSEYQCFMECKNCGAKYHNLKMCPKPANLSIVLQNFMEFCLQQCSQYNPEKKYTFNTENIATELYCSLQSSRLTANDNEILNKTKSDHKKSKKKRKYIKSSESSETDSSSSSDTKVSSKKKKLNPTNQFQLPFYPMTPQPFNPLAAAAMLAYPSAYIGNKR